MVHKGKIQSSLQHHNILKTKHKKEQNTTRICIQSKSLRMQCSSMFLSLLRSVNPGAPVQKIEVTDVKASFSKTLKLKV